ncbi:hypothetical protein UY3_17960 [Chelonia mydas]|uniref:Uncharacterized protein n=1 Tax=Chelonia mydas TaxID=8469 RepID=M7B9S9_CHEMY|nr:hypothetical protein UY3_17960 [Chelonia mydas]
MRVAGSGGQYIPRPAPLPAAPLWLERRKAGAGAPIGLEQRTADTGSCDRPNLLTRQGGLGLEASWPCITLTQNRAERSPPEAYITELRQRKPP